MNSKPMNGKLKSVGQARVRGAVELETALLAIPMIMLLLLVGAVVRVTSVGSSVDDAAGSAARAASISRSPMEAREAAQKAVASSMGDRAARCTTNVDTSQWGTRPGTPGTVSATVTCRVPLGDLSLPGLPDKTMTSSATSVVDTFRERG